MAWRLVERATYLASGEWLLKRRANGGTIILLRSGFVALLLWIAAVCVRSRLTPHSSWQPSFAVFQAEAHDILPWFGAIFAGVYAGFYSRFSAQWSYLAEFYNQVMQTQVQCPMTEDNREAYTKWFVAFVDDAEGLHLARKPAFAFVVKSLLEKPGVQELYVSAGPSCERYLSELLRDVGAVIERENGGSVPTKEPSPK